MKNLSTLVLLFFSCFSMAMAQTPQGTISGKVLDAEEQAVEFATVALFSNADTSLVKAAYTDESGAFEIFPVPEGSFHLKISSFEMKAYTSAAIDLTKNQSLQLPVITMESASTEIEAVQITAKKPMITVKPDMTVFNVEGNPVAANSNALELMRKAPGVMVDNDDNIQVLGRAGVQVMINGKPSPLRGEDLAAFLKSMPSDQIEAIEIVTNPSAKYDAEGNAGVINIRLRRDKKLGTSANFNLGYSVGFYSRYNGGATVNYRGKKLSAFASYNNFTGQWNEFINIYREQNGLEIDQQASTPGKFRNNRFRGGLDYQFTPKHSLGIQASGGIGARYAVTNSVAEIASNGQVLNYLVATNDASRDMMDQNYNLNYKYTGEKGSSLTMDVDYGGYDISNNSDQTNTYLASDAATFEEARNYRNYAPTDIDIWTAKTDYERPLWGGKMEAGAKFSMVTTDNIFDFYNVAGTEESLDTERSNQFVYTENVNAAYVSYQRPYKKFNFQAGLRAEQTNSLGELTAMQATNNDRVERNYLNLFPSGGVTYQPSQKHAYRLNYSRRIDRPNYQHLNPFENKLDELTYQVGNPFLQPQMTHSLQLTHTYKYALNTTLSYSMTEDFFSQILDTTEVSATFQTTDNLARQQVVSLNVSFPHQINKIWSTFTNMTGTYTHNEADFGEGKTINISQPSFNIYHQSTFQLPKNFSVQLSGWYQSPALFAANLKMQSMNGVDVGASWSFLDKRGNIQLTYSDIFWGQQWNGIQEFGGLYFEGSGGNDTRQFRARLTWEFGNSNVKAKKRKTGLEAESGRVGGGN